MCRREDRPVKPMWIEKATMNRYGRFVAVLKGLLFGPLALVTRVHEWTIRLIPRIENRQSDNLAATRNEKSIGQIADFRAPPEACVNLDLCQ